MQLTEHFSYEELGICGAVQEVIENYRYLCAYILEPVRIIFEAPMHITSGYRDVVHNNRVGGKAYSYHLGESDHAAVDCFLSGVNVVSLFNYVRLSGLPFDKVILEKKGGVPVIVHIQSRRLQQPRRQAYIGGTGDSHNYVEVKPGESVSL